MDLFVNDANDVSSGNMRRRANEQMNEAVGAHNSVIATNITNIHKQLQTGESQLSEQEALGSIAGGVEGMMGAHSFAGALQDYKQARDARGAQQASKTARLRSLVSQAPDGGEGNLRMGQGENGVATVEVPPSSTPDAPPSASPEGTSATPSSNTAPTNAEHEVVTVGEDGKGKTGSMIHEGIKSISGLSDDAIDKVGKGAGVLGSAVTGGMDIYKDVKAGGIAGDNGWEKAGNITQLGGSIADIAGVIPGLEPLAVVGGFLDLLGGGLDSIGEAVEGGKKKDEAESAAKTQEAQQKAQVAQLAPATGSAPVALAKVQ